MLRLLSVLAFLMHALPAYAEREIHVVSVQNGWLAAGDFRNAPQAQVYVDRPEATVILVLLDTGGVDWKVETAPGSFVEEIILGGDPATSQQFILDAKSRVFFHDVPFDLEDETQLPFVGFPRGNLFRNLLHQLYDRTGINTVTSLQHKFRASETPFVVSQPSQEIRSLYLSYLEDALSPLDGLPDPLLTWLNQTRHQDAAVARFDEAGMEIADAAGVRAFPRTPNIEEPFLPRGAYFDPESEAIYGVSFGGIGYIYRVDTKTGIWSVVTDLQGYNGQAILYDAATDQVILTGVRNRPGEIAVVSPDLSLSVQLFSVQNMPGYTDLYSYPNEIAPALIPKIYHAPWLLAETSVTVDAPQVGYGKRRLYALNLDTQEVRLLEYENYE